MIYSNRSSIVINLRGLDKYHGKHTDSWTNVQENIGGTFEITITDGEYVRRERYENYMFK